MAMCSGNSSAQAVSNCGTLKPVEPLRVGSYDESATFVLREP
jgi:hypothetical protein